MPVVAGRSPYQPRRSQSRLSKTRNKKHASFWAKWKHQFSATKRQKTIARPEAPEPPKLREDMTQSEYKMLEAFRIKPEDLDLDTEAKWAQTWDEAERLAATSGNPKHKAEFEVMQRVYSREGLKNYVDVDPNGPEEEWAMGVLVNAAHFLYLADEQALLETWKDVENTYLTRADITNRYMMQAGLQTPAAEYTFGANAGGDGDAVVVPALAEPAPDWTSRDHFRMIMGTIKWSIVGISAGLGGAAAVSAVGPAMATGMAAYGLSTTVNSILLGLITTSVGTVAGGAVGAAAQGGIDKAAKHLGPKCVNLVAQCMTLPDAFMSAASLFTRTQYDWALSDLARFNAKYYELSEKNAKDIAEFLIAKAPAAEKAQLRGELFREAVLGAEGSVNKEKAQDLFRDYFYDPETYKGTRSGRFITVTPDRVMDDVKSDMSKAFGKRSSAYTANAEAAKNMSQQLYENENNLVGSAKWTFDLLRENFFFCSFQSLMAFCKVRKLKEKESIVWLKEFTKPPASKTDRNLYGLKGSPIWTKYDAYLHLWNETIFCSVSDETIQTYIDNGLNATPPTGILRNAEWSDGDVPRWILPTDYQTETYGKNTRASQWSPTVADAIGGETSTPIDVELLKEFCTLNPREEREAIFARFELILTDMKTVLVDNNVADAKRENYWTEIYDPRKWIKVPVRAIMVKLSPLTYAWQKQSERLILKRMRFGEGGETSVQKLYKIRRNNPACVRFLSPNDRLRIYDGYLQEYAALAAQDAIDDGESKEDTQTKAADAVAEAARRYDALTDTQRNDIEKRARARAARMYDAHKKAQQEAAREKAKRVEAARKVELKLADKKATDAGDEALREWVAQMRDGDDDDDEDEESTLYEAVARVAYETATSFPNLTDADATGIAVRVAKKIAAQQEKQKAAQDRAEASAAKRAEAAAKKAADKAAEAEKARQDAPTRVMELVEARAAAREKARNTANELLEADPDTDPVELEGLAALAAAEEVREHHSSVPQQGIRQVGIEAARAALRERGARADGNDGRDPDEPQLAPLGGGVGQMNVDGAEAANFVLRTGASASVVADVFARLSL